MIVTTLLFKNNRTIIVLLVILICFYQNSSAQIHRWTPSNEGLTTLDVQSLTSLSNKIIFTGTNDGVFCSTNGGFSWAQKSSGLTYNFVELLGTNHLNFVYVGISGGYPPYDLHSQCMITADTANSWQSIDIGYMDYDFMSISAADSINIFATIWGVYNFLYGGNHYIIQSTDGGYTWETKKSFLDNNSSIPNPIITRDSLVLVGRSDPPNLFRSTDFGTTWQGLYIDSSSFPPAILSLNYNRLGTIFASTSNKIFKSTDSGLTWQILSQSPTWVSAMYCEDDGGILAAGHPLMYSSNFGITWNTDTIGLGTTYVNSILYVSGKFLVGTGSDGLYSSGTLNENEKEIITPSVFGLSQNYPNPFNPSTTIKYEMAYDNFISIKVYDILGREIEILVNEFKPAGSYRVNFIGNNLPSGNYFYRIQAGNYSEVKKMILLR